jgi:hypothetical protein
LACHDFAPTSPTPWRSSTRASKARKHRAAHTGTRRSGLQVAADGCRVAAAGVHCGGCVPQVGEGVM